MKKRLAVVLCAAMMLSACGGASGSDQAADTKGQAEADSKADDTEGSKGDGKLVLSTYGLSEDISEDEVYTPFEQEFGRRPFSLPGINSRGCLFPGCMPLRHEA